MEKYTVCKTSEEKRQLFKIHLTPPKIKRICELCQNVPPLHFHNPPCDLFSKTNIYIVTNRDVDRFWPILIRDFDSLRPSNKGNLDMSNHVIFPSSQTLMCPKNNIYIVIYWEVGTFWSILTSGFDPLCSQNKVNVGNMSNQWLLEWLGGVLASYCYKDNRTTLLTNPFRLFWVALMGPNWIAHLSFTKKTIQFHQFVRKWAHRSSHLLPWY